MPIVRWSRKFGCDLDVKQWRPSRIKGRNTRGRVPGKERQGEDGRAKEPATRTRCGLLSGLSDSEVLEERREREQNENDPWSVHHPQRWDGEGSQGVVIRGHRSWLAGVAGEEGGQGGFGDPLTVGLILEQQPRGEDEEARCGDHHWLEVLDIDVEVQSRPAGHPSRTTVCDTIVVLAGGRHCCIGLGGVGSHLQMKIWHFAMAFATWWTFFCGPCSS